MKVAAASFGTRTQHRTNDASCVPHRSNALQKKSSAEREDEEALRSFSESNPRTYQGDP
jgi:hypothetical protein